MISYYVNADLIDSFIHNDMDAMVHGCNCFHLMGAGIAKSVAEKLPEAYEVDKKYTQYGDWEKLGTYSSCEYSFGTVINAYTQYTPGFVRPKQQLYDNIKSVFKLINENFSGKVIGIPKIGAGIAGGEWDKIAKIINESTPNVKIIVYYI